MLYICLSCIFALLFSGQIGYAQSVGLQRIYNYKSNSESRDILDVVASQTREGEMSASGILPIPDGTHELPLEPNCLPQKFEDELYSLRQSHQQWSQSLAKYLEKCSKKLANGKSSGLIAMAKFALTKYDFAENSELQAVHMQTSDGVKTFGYLGIKKDSIPRPLVIIKCGLYCSGEPSTSTRNYLMPFFDESPFHVLLLSSHSAPEHISANKEMVFGGYREAVGLIEIAEWLRHDSSFKDKISDMHLVGLSLGGHAALYSSYYNDRVRDLTGAAPLDSVIAICPVVNLKPTMKSLFSFKDTVSKAASIETWINMRKVYPHLPEAQDLYSPDEKPKFEKIPVTMATLAVRYLRTKSTPDFVGDIVNSVDDFWRVNSFSGFIQKTKTSTLVFTADDDMFVKTPMNAGALIEEIKSNRISNPYFQVQTVPKGNHCGYATTYGSDFLTRLVRSYIINHSPNFGQKQELEFKALSIPKIELADRELHVMQKWQGVKNANYVNLQFVVHGPYDAYCSRVPFGGSHFCLKQKTVQIPFKDLPFTVSKPKSEAEAQALTRKLNASIEVYAGNRRLTGTKLQPSTMKWYSNWFN